MQKRIITVVVAVVTFGTGLFLGNLINYQPSPEKVQSVIPVRPTKFGYEKPATKEKPRSSVIADFVGQWNRTREEYNRLSKFEAKDPDSFGGEIQALYRVGENFSELRKTMEINQLTPTEVGVSHQQLRRHEAIAYRRTLDAVYKLQKMGGTNRCIFEGGCFDTPEHIRRVDSHITGLVLELE